MACCSSASTATTPTTRRARSSTRATSTSSRSSTVFEKSGRTVPVFCDKHLSYDRTKAAEMVATAKKMGFPLMAGSQPARHVAAAGAGAQARHEDHRGARRVARRTGDLRHPRARSAAVHGRAALHRRELRVRRQQGVKAVTCLQGDAVWKAGDDGAVVVGVARTRARPQPVAQRRRRPRQLPALPAARRPGATSSRGRSRSSIEYRDGLKATVLQLDGHVADDTFAARIDGETKPASCAVLAAAAARCRVPRSAGVAHRDVPRDRQAALPRRTDATHRRHPRLRPGIARRRTRSAWRRPTWTSATTRPPTAASCAATTRGR